MSNRKKSGIRFAGKGYYIALILCVAAIGISGYLYYRNAAKPEKPSLNNPSEVVTPGEDTPVVAPEPTVPAIKPDKPTPPPVKEPLKVGQPLKGKTITDFAMDCLCYNETTRDWRTHNGIDIAAEAGSKVCAAADGTVYNVYDDDTMGTTVVIRHADGYVTKYASLGKKVSVAAGDKVKLGQAIGTVGNTALLENAIGDHLHFSVSCNDKPVNPVDFLKMK